jgi:hypothetical protein
MMKRPVSARALLALLGVIVFPLVGAAACTPIPPALKVSWGFVGLPLQSPGAGVNEGDSATLVYRVTSLPKGDEVAIQRATVIRNLNGTSMTQWILVVAASTRLTSAANVLPAFGRTTYRVAVLDGAGNVVAATAHTIDSYQLFTLGFLANRPTRTVTTGAGKPFSYVFQSEIDLAHTSCRQLTGMRMYDSGLESRDLKITHTLGNKTTSNEFTAGGFRQVSFGPVPVTPGEDLDLKVVNNAALGDTLDIFGEAYCFTVSGTY